jgi:hypothetical protein
LSVVAEGGWLVWSNAPVVVLNIDDGTGGALVGILGSNLFGDRDYVINALDSPPYLDVSDPVVSPSMRITGIRRPQADVIELDWHCQPAPGSLVLQFTDGLSSQPAVWNSMSTAQMSTIMGTFSVTGSVQRRMFRLFAP